MRKNIWYYQRKLEWKKLDCFCIKLEKKSEEWFTKDNWLNIKNSERKRGCVTKDRDLEHLLNKKIGCERYCTLNSNKRRSTCW